jgi:CRISPR-associated protein Csb2
MPLDTDGDGNIDHLLIIGREPLDNTERVALDRFQSIWQPDGKPDLTFVPVKWGDQKSLLEPLTVFVSATPFVPPRHFRKGRGEYIGWLRAELCREAINHGLPAPERVIPVPSLPDRLRTIHWIEFRRNRKDEDEKAGFGFRLEFKEPVLGPFAIGYGAHFGLGLFMPVKED